MDEVAANAPGVAVLAISALRGGGLGELRAHLAPGRTIALAGSSGAGKSTLVNALLGEERMAIGAVRTRDGRGRHVTSHRQLVLLAAGGVLLDTPGMRELQLPDEAGLEAAFEDVAALARSCRFTDCGHGGEPGCAVRDAVEAGELASCDESAASRVRRPPPVSRCAPLPEPTYSPPTAWSPP